MKRYLRLILSGALLIGLIYILLIGSKLPSLNISTDSPGSQFTSMDPDAGSNPLMSESKSFAAFAAGKEDDPLALERWFWEQRAYPLGRIPMAVHDKAIQIEMRTPYNPKSASAVTWQSLGPAPLNDITYGGQSEQDASGRALSVAIHPTNANIILLGAAQGGIWKSTDGGKNFTAVADSMPSLAIKVIRFAPSNPNIVYAGTGEPHGSTSIYGQGVLKSTDGGSTWQALPNKGTGWDFQYASVSGLQVHPTNANIVFITTAAIRTSVHHFNPAGAPQTGIFKSADGGQTWSLLKAAKLYPAAFTSMDGNIGFMDLELATSNPNLMYASEYFGGVWKSIDGGTTWNLMTPLKNGQGADLPAPVVNFGYYSSSQGLFFVLTRFPYLDQYPEFMRIELGLAQSNPNVIYAGYSVVLLLDADNDGIFTNGVDLVQPAGLLFKSIDGGANWTWLGDWPRNGVPNYCDTQCSYDNTIEVNPVNANDVLIGGSANYNGIWPDPKLNPTRFLILPWRGMMYRSPDGGTTWVDTTPQCTSISTTSGGTFGGLPYYTCNPNAANKVIHPDVHSIAFAPNNQIYVANDGGLYRATVAGTGANSTDYTWANLNAGLSTLQFYFFDDHPTDANKILGGLQDNSVAYWNGTTWEGWGFGDGTFGAFDPKEPLHVYMGTQFNVHRHDNGGAKRALDANGNPANGWELSIFPTTNIQKIDPVSFIVPFEIDPVGTTRVYAASNTGLYRSTDRGANWSIRLNSTATNGTPTTISVSPANNNYVWLGTSTGKVYLYNLAVGNEPTLLSTGLPGRYITMIEASPSKANTVYVTFSGYDANTPTTPGKVFKSVDLGKTWVNISGNLPDVPVSSLALDPNNPLRMWAGADVGVFTTTDGGTTWSSYRNNMPVVAIMDLKYNATTKYLTTVTHGRGVWRVAPDGTGPTKRFLYMPLVLGGSKSAVPTPTPTSTPQFTPTPTNTPAPLPSFKNYNFEQGNNGDWTEISTNFPTLITNSGFSFTPVSGQWLAWLGGAENEYSSLSQTISVPSNAPSFYLYFYYQIRSNELNCNDPGWSDAFLLSLNADLKGGFILCQTNNTTQWSLTALNLDLRTYAGQNVTFSFDVQTDATANTSSSFFIEDVVFDTTPPTALSTGVILEDIPAAP